MGWQCTCVFRGERRRVTNDICVTVHVNGSNVQLKFNQKRNVMSIAALVGELVNYLNKTQIVTKLVKTKEI